MEEAPISEINNILRIIQVETETNCLNELINFFKRYPLMHFSLLRYQKTGDNVLHIAARLNYSNIIEYLLDKSGLECVDIKNNDNKTPLHEAAQFANLNSLKLLIRCGANVNAIKRGDWTCLMLSCTRIKHEDINLEMVRILMNNGAMINYQNKDGWSALHLIGREPAPNILQYLIDNNADLTLVTKNGRSVLHIACLHMNMDIIHILLRANVDINLKDKSGNTPLHEAAISGNIDIIDLLLAKGADLFACNSAEFTILHLAASICQLITVKHIIISCKVPVNTCNKSNVMPLHCAGKSRNKIVYDYLRSVGADETIKDKFGRTPLDYLNGDI